MSHYIVDSGLNCQHRLVSAGFGGELDCSPMYFMNILQEDIRSVCAAVGRSVGRFSGKQVIHIFPF
jgi:hypothetical protein